MQPLNVFLSRKFFTHDGFSLKGTHLLRFPSWFLLFNFCYVSKDHPNPHLSKFANKNKGTMCSRELPITVLAKKITSRMGIFQFWFHHFSAFCFKKFGRYFSWHTKEWYPSVVCTLLVISFPEYRCNHICSPISGGFAKLPHNLTHLP